MNLSTTQYICRRCIRHLTRSRTSVPSSSFNNAPNRRKYTTKPVQNDRPFRMAIIGSGPAGFYTALKVTSKIENAKVDMYEHLPTPFGLVRYGVAPDHPEVKNCQERFEGLAESPNFTFIGNVNIGEAPNSLPLKTLIPHYDAVVFAYGASKDKKLNIPGEDLKGIYPARAFVGWYNGLPEYADLAPELETGNHAAVIGQGNVALDVARILLTDIDVLKKTDITEEALDVLATSKIRHVSIIGRRGPCQAAFTIKELRELLTLPNAEFDRSRSIEEPPSRFLSQDQPPFIPPPEILKKMPRSQKRILELLKRDSQTPSCLSKSKTWSLDFLLSPLQFSKISEKYAGALPETSEHVNSIECAHNMYLGSTPEEILKASFDSNAQVVPRKELPTWRIEANLAFRSIGYKSEPLPGFEDPESRVPFDEKRGIICNDGVGRVVDPKAGEKVIPNLYCAGWVKTGPTGVIASTMVHAFTTGDAIVSDWNERTQAHEIKNRAGGWEAVKSEVEKRGIRSISWGDWKKIDEEERRRGKEKGKERVKFRRVEEMLAVLG